ncbi:hypothetical protein PC129_g10778 [Phytophthora cactorum]|uniref:Uncharacterized protein n=1 Tax=Phytophthora cactorum TaxID=29920 RepID=A0A329S8J2_9STRA|nr:hypothetical protein Pcac1_g7238 [Phytophthora cactorum]KAG2805242.1 hypothetical protein PC111_g17902 [Phytophthora cactorum]KAG2821957.1 hypothetical protein PC112_g11148 [Phytophthora cactorum]KAG2856806.1 hypothetical protein PC113_g11236 [Phytophthora cactorum]KAG2918387.1 hypothetical protein PC115_g10446 [Phytophthora cactorum]
MTRPVHVKFLIDNTSAVAWQSRMASQNMRSQVLIRLIVISEHHFDLRLSADHIPGREHDRRRGILPLGEYIPRTDVRQANKRLVPNPATVWVRWPRDRLARHLREHSVADSSFKAYARSYAKWTHWTVRRGVCWHSGIPLIDQIRLISEFIIDNSLDGHGSGNMVRGPTMNTYLCGIRHYLRAAGHMFSSDHPQIHMLLRGICRSDHPHQQRASASVAILEACDPTLDLSTPADQVL